MKFIKVKIQSLKLYVNILFCIVLIAFPEAAVRGTVKNSQTHKSVAGVIVSVNGTDFSAVTDSAGYFTIDSVPDGSVNLLFTHEKYEPFTLNDVYISGSLDKVVDAELVPGLQKLDKVVVTGNAFRKAPDMATSTKIMNFDEILRSPGALVDVQRAVQDLPSVSSGGDNTNEIVVRGGNPGENLLILDNMEISNPNHFASQGSGGGVVSLINPLLVRGLTFCAGAPPAQYGGKASSVLDIKLRDGNDKMVIGGVDLGMAGVGIHAEGPLWNGSTFMLSGSKSFLDLFAHFASTTAIPRYWGMQAKLTQTLGIHKLWGNFLYGDNSITIENADDEAGTDGDIIESGGNVYAGGVNLDSKWTSRFSTIMTLSGCGNGFDRYEFTDTTIGNSRVTDSFFVNKSSEIEETARLQAVLTLDKSKIQAGAYLKRCDFDIDIWERPDTIGSSVYQTLCNQHDIAYKYGGFLSATLFPREKLRIIPGVRADGFTYNNSYYFSPRLGTVYSLLPSLDITASAAVQYQDPSYTDLTAAKENNNLEPVRVITGIAGFEYNFRPQAAKLSVEGYYKSYDDLPVNASLLTADIYDQSDRVLSTGRGYSYGIEFFLHKKLMDHFSGSLAYSLSRAFNEDPRPNHEGEMYRSDYDFRNAFTITAGYKTEFLTREWYRKIHSKWWLKAMSPIFPFADRVEISTKWRYLGGRPFTRPKWDGTYQRYIESQENLNNDQYPDYHRLDLRIERRYGFGVFQVIYYFDLQNIYNRENIWMYLYSNKNHTETPVYQFSFFPAGGVILGF